MDATASVPFEGVSGAINVSIVAFSIVFGVLLGLTVMIYAIRIFSRAEAPKQDGPAGGRSAPAPATVPSAAPVAAQGAAPQQKIVAAITGAILAATGGRGRVVSIAPASQARVGSTWRTSGIVALVSGRLVRPWKR